MKKWPVIILTIFLFVTVTPVFAQHQIHGIEWDKTFGGAESDKAYSIIQTQDGGYAICGGTESKSAGGSDAWVIKLDGLGERVWERTFGDSLFDVALSIIQTVDGSYAVCGVKESKGDGDRDFWVIKLNSLGNKVWEKTFGGPEWDGARSIIQSADGGYVVCGLTGSKGAAGYDVWVIKLDDIGERVWDKTLGGSEGDGAESIIQTEDGGYAICGWTESKGFGGRDFWVIKLDKSGGKVWDKTFGGSNLDMARSIIQTKDGGYAICGDTRSKGSGDRDFLIIKLTSSGLKAWEKTLGGSNYDVARSIVQTDDDGYIICGLTASQGVGGSDVWVNKLDQHGRRVWNKTYGGLSSDAAFSIIQTQSGGYAICGETKSKGAGDYDAWVIKLSSVGEVGWDKTFGGLKNDAAYAIIQTMDGGYAVCGATESEDVGDFNCRIIKLDRRAEKVWDKTFGGPQKDAAYAMIQTMDGGYAVCGATESEGGDLDYWVIRLDDRGEKIWDKTFGGQGRDVAYSVVQTRNGDFVICGATGSRGSGGLDCWIIKLDKLGESIWEKAYGSNSRDEGRSIIQTVDGGYAVCGETISKKTQSSDIWILKLDQRGEKVWERTFGELGSDRGYSIIQTKDKGYAVCGETTPAGSQKVDLLIVKLDEHGNTLWQKNPFPSSGCSWVLAIANNRWWLCDLRKDRIAKFRWP